MTMHQKVDVLIFLIYIQKGQFWKKIKKKKKENQGWPFFCLLLSASFFPYKKFIKILLRQYFDAMSLVYKIKLFNALQTQFGSSKYTSLKTNLQNATLNWKWRRHLKSSIYYVHHKNQQA